MLTLEIIISKVLKIASLKILQLHANDVFTCFAFFLNSNKLLIYNFDEESGKIHTFFHGCISYKHLSEMFNETMPLI